MANRPNTHVTGQGKAVTKKPPAMQSMQSTKRVVRKRSNAPQAKPSTIAPEERHQLIAQTAYLIAEQRGFAPGHELDDWLRAEAEVESRLGAAPH